MSGSQPRHSDLIHKGCNLNIGSFESSPGNPNVQLSLEAPAMVYCLLVPCLCYRGISGGGEQEGQAGWGQGCS